MNFPAIAPSSRTYIPGNFASSSINVLSGKETNVRHSSTAFGHQLKLKFKSVTTSQRHEIVSHYMLHANFETFDLTTTTLVATNLTFPTSYEWRYSDSPEIEEDEGQIDITIKLELLPPYTI
tara:strand:- start:797 stop:1162 length:366 start_codon:yes stop_codon:yes gene_type:complete